MGESMFRFCAKLKYIHSNIYIGRISGKQKKCCVIVVGGAVALETDTFFSSVHVVLLTITHHRHVASSKLKQ